MTRWFNFLFIGLVFLFFCSCSTTSTMDGELQAEIAQMRAEQEDMVDDLESSYNYDAVFADIGADFKRHNWIEWPLAATLWGMTFISTGHQRRDFKKLHKDMDRYFFNAPWDDPYLGD